MVNPIVSVIILVYNAQKHLCDAVKSVLIRYLQQSEIILINDGSKDDSPQVCQQLSSRMAASV